MQCECHIKGYNAGLKRARSDATLCSFVESNDHRTACATLVDAEHPSPPKKRHRGILETAYTESPPHTPCDPYTPRLSSEYPPTNVPPSFDETSQTKAQCHQGGPSTVPNKQHGRGSFAVSNRPLGVHNEACSPPPASSEHISSSSEPFNARSPELSSRPAAPEGEATRIEITFEKLYNELLCSCDHGSLIQEVAERISTGSKWLTAYHAYKETLRWARFYSGAGFRKNRFVDLMNLVVEEAPECGLSVPYTHQLRYNRYHYDGSEWSPEKCSEEGSSESGSRDSGASKQSALSLCACQAFAVDLIVTRWPLWRRRIIRSGLM